MNAYYLRNYPSIKWVSIISLCFALLLLMTPQNVQAQSAPPQNAHADTSSRPVIEIEHVAVASHVQLGGTVEFTVAVTNTGDIRLENVTVFNTSAPDCTRSIGVMEPNQTHRYTCELQEIYTHITSRSTVVGAAADSPLAVDSAETTVEIANPILAIIPNIVQSQATGGERITKTFNCKNSGTGAAVGVQLVEVVPEGTHFLPEESDAGWACENGDVEAGAICFYTIDLIAAGDFATGMFPFVVLQDADDEEAIPRDGATVTLPNDMRPTLFLPFVHN